MTRDRHESGRYFDRSGPPATAKAALPRDERTRLAFAGSLLVHLAVFAALMLAVPPRLPKEIAERGIDVELAVDPTRASDRATPQPAPPATPLEPAATPGEAPSSPTVATPADPAAKAPRDAKADAPREAEAKADDGLIHAEHFLSAKRLAEPRNRQAREAMRQFAPEERITQLCNLEAMEQIHARTSAGAPQTVIADALGEAKRSALAIDASNAAVLSGGRWLRLAFRCEVSPDLGQVTAFAFRLGDEVSRADRRRHELPTDGGDMD